MKKKKRKKNLGELQADVLDQKTRKANVLKDLGLF